MVGRGVPAGGSVVGSGRIPARTGRRSQAGLPSTSAAARHAVGDTGRSLSLDGATPGFDHISTDDVLALQRAAGNRAVAEAVSLIAQRVPVKNAPTGETVYNQAAAGGQAGAKHYTITAAYEMNRSGDSGVTVTVKIKFLSQARNTVPKPPGAPPGTPDAGDLVGPQTEIPAGDERRGWATTTAGDAVRHWNGRLTLVGEEWNAFSENTKKRLPVTFQAIPVFGIGEEAHNTVIVHPATVVGGSTGNPIDAGNFYKKKDDAAYPASDDLIYAHEYGHLLGIPDEYSQSNEQMNALLHQAAPAGAASSQAALDRTTVERMTLAALSRPLSAQLDAAMPAVTAALRAQRPLVKAKMAKAARDAVASSAVRDDLRAQLAAGSEGSVSPSIPGAVAFETTTNFSNRTQAGAGVEAGFSAAALGTQISDAYWKALTGAQRATTAVAGLGDVRVNVANAVYGASGAGTATAGNASAVAASTVGPAAGPGLPAVAPPASLLAELSGLPATWAAAGSALEAGVTPAAFTEKMQAALRSAAAAEAAVAAGLPPGVAPASKIATARGLYEKAYQLVTNASKVASQQVATDLVAATVNPVLATSVSSLQGTIATEVTRLMTTPPAGMAAAGTPDPNMTAVVTAMKGRLDTAKAATAGTGRDPLGAPGGTAPAQDVTYSYQGLMGSNKTDAMRADQFAPVVNQFNDKLATLFEKKFSAEVK